MGVRHTIIEYSMAPCTPHLGILSSGSAQSRPGVVACRLARAPSAGGRTDRAKLRIGFVVFHVVAPEQRQFGHSMSLIGRSGHMTSLTGGMLDHRPAFFLACLIPARNPRCTILAYPASSIDAITAAAVPPGVEASCSKSSKGEVPARQAAIPSASA
jgi:hypothetical protein